MEKCEQCGGRVRFSRAQQLLECMECGALYAPSAAMIIGPSAQPSESTEAHRLELEADGAAIKDPPVPKGYVATCRLNLIIELFGNNMTVPPIKQ